MCAHFYKGHTQYKDMQYDYTVNYITNDNVTKTSPTSTLYSSRNMSSGSIQNLFVTTKKIDHNNLCMLNLQHKEPTQDTTIIIMAKLVHVHIVMITITVTC